MSDVKSGTNLKEADWGYDLYPERRGQKAKSTWWDVAFRGEGRENVDKIKCERRVYSCTQKSKKLIFS